VCGKKHFIPLEKKCSLQHFPYLDINNEGSDKLFPCLDGNSESSRNHPPRLGINNESSEKRSPHLDSYNKGSKKHSTHRLRRTGREAPSSGRLQQILEDKGGSVASDAEKMAKPISHCLCATG